MERRLPDKGHTQSHGSRGASDACTTSDLHTEPLLRYIDSEAHTAVFTRIGKQDQFSNFPGPWYTPEGSKKVDNIAVHMSSFLLAQYMFV